MLNERGGIFLMAKLDGITQIELIAQKSKNLDTICYRGDAPLAHLALISEADIFDQVTNPEGLQRDLLRKHANEAYEYAAQDKPDHPRAFPEIVLNVRNKRLLQMEEDEFGKIHLRFEIDKISKLHEKGDITVSRIDGNHRLFYAAGDDRHNPILNSVPFQIQVGLSREEERSLFVDINANQKGLNSSHLATMQNHLTTEQNEIKNHLDRWIANKLSTDPASPWHGLIHLGGSKKGSRTAGLTRIVNLASLQAGVLKTIKKSQYIHDFTDANAQYIIIRNYWEAVKEVFSKEWSEPKNHLVIKNIGVLSLSILGGTIVDRCIPQKKITVGDMAYYLRQAYPKFDWASNSTGVRAITGMSGNQAAQIIAGEMAILLSDNSVGSEIKDLQDLLLASE